jgi:polysaccharide biosynthesis PFTS motif protein
MIYGLLRIKSRIPSSVVFSLTSEQVFQSSNIKDVLTSLKEKRFQDHFRADNPLIEVRSIKSLLVRNKMITIDAPLFLLIRCVKRRHYGSLLMKVFKSVSLFRNQELLALKGMKKVVLDRAVFKILYQDLYPEFDLVTTNSTLKKLPIAFECPLKGRRVMVWYSTNSKPFNFRANQQSLGWDIGAVKNGLDSHLVWTKYDVTFLKLLGINNVHAIGPILFQTQIVAERSTHNYVITFFDVTPIAPSNNWIVRNQENIYSERDALGDFEAFKKLSADLLNSYINKVKVRIKPKRAYSPLHSKKYIDQIIESCREHQIELLSPNENLYKVISQSDLVIATPWTSPAVLAKEMGLNSVFFAIRSTDWELPTCYEGIRVIKSLSELTAYINLDIQKKFNR